MTEWQNERPEFAGGPLVVTTVGMAVADLYSTMAQYWETLGWGPGRSIARSRRP